MEKAFTVFVSGIGGVFLGMLLLYASMKITSIVTDKYFAVKEKK